MSRYSAKAPTTSLVKQVREIKRELKTLPKTKKEQKEASKKLVVPKAKRKTRPTTKDKRGRRGYLHDVTSEFVGQIKTLWDLGLSQSDISKRCKVDRRKIAAIMQHYDDLFPPHGVAPKSKEELDPDELERFCTMYEGGVRVEEIMEAIGWNRSKCYRVARECGLRRHIDNPTHPDHTPEAREVEKVQVLSVEDPDVITEQIEQDKKKAEIQRATALAQLESQGEITTAEARRNEIRFRTENLKDLQEIEFDHQMKTSEFVETLAYQTLQMAGSRGPLGAPSAGELLAIDNPDVLLKTSQFVQNCANMLQKNLDKRHNLIALDKQTESAVDTSLFNIDFLGAAQRAGLPVSIMHDEREEDDERRA